MSAVTGRSARHGDRAERIVLAWTRRYTRGIERTIADDRVAELRSDVWEQRETARWHHRTDLRTALSVLGRMLRGIPADLSWRRSELVGDPLRPASRFSVAWTVRWSVVLATAIAAIALLAATVAATRLVMGSDLATAVPGAAKVSLVVGIAATVAGLGLLRRERTRWLAALWIGFGTTVAFRASAETLFVVSTTARQYATPIAQPSAWVCLGAVAAFFAILALAWGLAAERRGTS